MRVARAGYYGGDPARVLSARVDLVLAVAEYDLFVSDYERAFMELNRES